MNSSSRINSLEICLSQQSHRNGERNMITVQRTVEALSALLQLGPITAVFIRLVSPKCWPRHSIGE